MTDTYRIENDGRRLSDDPSSLRSRVSTISVSVSEESVPNGIPIHQTPPRQFEDKDNRFSLQRQSQVSTISDSELEEGIGNGISMRQRSRHSNDRYVVQEGSQTNNPTQSRRSYFKGRHIQMMAFGLP